MRGVESTDNTFKWEGDYLGSKGRYLLVDEQRARVSGVGPERTSPPLQRTGRASLVLATEAAGELHVLGH